MITAKIIANSINPSGDRLTTFVLTFPRIVLAEFNTHRMLSRNSASSRAIPFSKMMDMVLQNCFIPIKWMKDHKGMQGTEFFSEEESKELIRLWLQSRTDAVERAQSLHHKGVTKQIINRLLEPFLWHTVIVTASEWENFFALRAHHAAEIHIASLAELMLKEYNNNIPKSLKIGEWHIPFGDNLDEDKNFGDFLVELEKQERIGDHSYYSILKWEDLQKVKISTARCARVSYNNFEGQNDYSKDIILHDNLSSAGHWSPFEHCARVMNDEEYDYLNGTTPGNRIGNGWSGNFKGFLQYRKFFKDENKKDSRINKLN